MSTISAPYAIPAPSTSTRPAAAVVRPTPVGALCAAMAGLAIALLPRATFMDLPRQPLVWTTFGTLLGLAILAYAAARKCRLNPWVAPASLLCIYCFIRYGWGTVVVQHWEDYPWQAYPHMRWMFHRFGMHENLPGGAQLILVFALGMFAGGMYSLSRPSSILPRFSWPFDEERLKRMLTIYLPVGCFINGSLQFGLPVSVKFTIGLFGSFLYPSILLGSYWLFSATNSRERTRWTIFLLVGCCGAIPVGLVTGQVNGMLMPGLMAMLGYVMAKGGPPWKTILFLMPVMFLFFLPFASIYKYGHEGQDAPEVMPRLQNSLKKFLAIGERARLELALDRSIQRFAGSNMPIMYTRYYPAVYPFEYGASMKIEASNLVPRLLWPDKPFGSYELNRYPAKIGIVAYDTNTTALFDAMSEYYLNFGMIGAFVLAVFHGLYWQGMYKWLVGKVNPLIGCVLVLAMMSQNEDFYSVPLSLTAQIKQIPVWLILFYFFSRKSQKHAPVL